MSMKRQRLLRGVAQDRRFCQSTNEPRFVSIAFRRSVFSRLLPCILLMVKRSSEAQVRTCFFAWLGTCS